MKKKLLFAVAAAIFSLGAFAQNDSLIMINGDVLIGELKNMNRGVATMETDYSDADFKIEWSGIKEIYTTTSYLITTSAGDRLNGKIASAAGDKVNILLEDSGTRVVPLNDIVFLKSVDKRFWDKLDAFVDVGFDLSKANNVRTLSTRSGISYMAPILSLGMNFNTNFTKQNEGPDIQRTDGDLTMNYYLPKDWYVPVSVTYLRSSEQNLQNRWNLLTGAGYYVLHTNQMYWGFSAGGAFNTENYVPDSIPDKNSFEGFFGTDLNLYDIGDFGLSTKIMAFPSFTESGRWRVDFNFNTKYDLPLDFYIKVGFSLNYDNQPVEGGADTDFTLHTGVGWEW